MLIKTGFLLFSTTYLCLLANISEAQTKTQLEHSAKLISNTKLCQIFSANKETDLQAFEAPLPVRRKLAEQKMNSLALTSGETEFYQSLGLIENPDGSYACMASDPVDSQRRFTLFKVKKVDGVVVISSFLDRGQFIAGQQEAITNLFLEMIDFYTEIPNQYYVGIKNYFQEFYSRIADGRIKPSGDRVYLVDEPESTVILYHPLQGSLKGTGLSLNIPLN